MYSPTQIEIITREYANLLREYRSVTESITVQGQDLPEGRVKEYLLHGIARRVSVLERAVENIFTLFPLTTSDVLPRNTLYDVQVNLHAFTMNLYGIFENCAWCFVLFHDLQSIIEDPRKISLFSRPTKRYLPETLINYLGTQNFTNWSKYLKSYRDSLAHRIPLYVPPATFTEADRERYNLLQAEQMECFRSYADGDICEELVNRAEQINLELESIGSPCPTFLHSFTDDTGNIPVAIHPQLISDSRSVIEFLNLFLDKWQDTENLTIGTNPCQ